MKTKITISPSQGLLILIDHYKADAEKVERLKKLYLNGGMNEFEKGEIKALLQEKILEKYDISFDKHVINNDASRRYFETHLSYETLSKTSDFTQSKLINDGLAKIEEAVKVENYTLALKAISELKKDYIVKFGRNNPSEQKSDLLSVMADIKSDIKQIKEKKDRFDAKLNKLDKVVQEKMSPKISGPTM